MQRRASVVRSVSLQGAEQSESWAVAAEVAVELDVNGVPVMVTMATPADLEDLAVGLAYTEGVVLDFAAIENIAVHESLEGVVVDLTVADAAVNEQARRSRLLEGRSGCGLCGVETLASAMRRPMVPASRALAGQIDDAALRRAFDALPGKQPLNALTHSVHAAAWCAPSGDIICVREDVGRHNALDKLAGWRLRTQGSLEHGFVILSSRLSYELVCKAAAMGAEMLAAVSAPTALALQLADAANLPLACLGPGGAIVRL